MDVLREQIQHVVVLMLENRSFDSLLGRLYPPSASFDGLTGNESNPALDGSPVPVWNQPGSDPTTLGIPDPDPGELYVDMNTQIFGTAVVPDPPTPSMQGFVRSYMGQPGPLARDPRAPMHGFTPEQVPVLATLARSFAVSDRWHACAPCQTWPNRFFVHTGTANGYENNSPEHFPYEMPTVFSRFDQAGYADAWRVYFHDVPQSLTLSDLWTRLDRFRLYPDFRQDAARGTLPSYAFIEPRYFPDVELPNDQHPPHLISLGEELIADVYNSLRAGPAWAQTLLIITYDEHGGCFDHVAPPAAVPPGPLATEPFNFDRYGVRVPAVLVSPYIAPGTVLRPPDGTKAFDHTSIIRTLRNRFDLGPPLSAREDAAADLGAVFTLDTPSNMGPASLSVTPYLARPAELARARLEPLNDMQAGLTRLAAHLPAPGPAEDLNAAVRDHIAALSAAAPHELDAAVTATRGSALAFIKARLAALFHAL